MSPAAFERWLAHAFTLARFGLVGGVVTAFNYVAFVGLQRLSLHYLAAATAAWAASVALGFLLSRRVTFRLKGPGRRREVALFVGANLVQLGLGLTLYWLLIGVLGIGSTLAFLCNGVVVAALSFLVQRFVIFPVRAERQTA